MSGERFAEVHSFFGEQIDVREGPKRARLDAGLDDDQADDDDVERLWSEETERRMAQLESDKAHTFARDKVRERLAALRAERLA